LKISHFLKDLLAMVERNELSKQQNFFKQKEHNSNKSPTRCNNFPVYYPDVYLQLNKFREFSRPSSGAQ
jgi:hypothetical protein